MGYHYFWSMFLDQKVSASHIELYQLIPQRKTSSCSTRPLTNFNIKILV